MRHRPVDHAFEQIQALLPVLDAHLRDLTAALRATGAQDVTVNLTVQSGWHPGNPLDTQITLSGVHPSANTSAHQTLAIATARQACAVWEDIIGARVEHLLSQVVENDPTKPALCLTFLAQATSGATVFHLRLETVADIAANVPKDMDRIGTPNSPRVLRALRLAAMAKGIGTGAQWLLSLDGVTSGFLRVQAPTARVALAWLVGTRVADLPERTAFGTSISLTEIHPEARPMLQRWSRIKPPLAPAPVSETHLGF